MRRDVARFAHPLIGADDLTVRADATRRRDARPWHVDARELAAPPEEPVIESGGVGVDPDDVSARIDALGIRQDGAGVLEGGDNQLPFRTGQRRVHGTCTNGDRGNRFEASHRLPPLPYMVELPGGAYHTRASTAVS